MPTKRTRIDRGRTDILTAAQKAHLQSGHYWFDWNGEADHFRSEEHRRAAWARYGPQIMAEWMKDLRANAGRRPVAFWEYQNNLTGTDRRDMRWPRGIESETHMVYQLPDTSPEERRLIEEQWLRHIGVAVSVGGGQGYACTWGGTPRAFYRQHAPALRKKAKAEAEAWRRHISRFPPS